MLTSHEGLHKNKFTSEMAQDNNLGVDFVQHTTEDLQKLLDVDGEYSYLLTAYSGILQFEPNRDSKQLRRQVADIKSYMNRILQDLLLVPEIEQAHKIIQSKTTLYTLSSVAEGIGELLGIPIHSNTLGIQTVNSMSRACAVEITPQKTISRIYTSLLSSKPEVFLHDWNALQKIVAQQPQKFGSNDALCQFVFIVPRGLRDVHEQFSKEHFGEIPANLIFQEGPATLSQIQGLAENFVYKLGFRQPKDTTSVIQPASIENVKAQVTLEPKVTATELVGKPQPVRRMPEVRSNDFLSHAQTILKQLVQLQQQRPTWGFMRKRLETLPGRDVLQHYLSTDTFQEFYVKAVSDFAKSHDGPGSLELERYFKGALFMLIAEDILRLSHGILEDVILDNNNTVEVYRQIFYPDKNTFQFPFGMRTMEKGITTLDGFAIGTSIEKIMYGVEISYSLTKDFVRSYIYMKGVARGFRSELFDSGLSLLAVVPKHHAFTDTEKEYIRQGKIKVTEMPFTRHQFLEFADMVYKQYRKKDVGKSLREIEMASRV